MARMVAWFVIKIYGHLIHPGGVIEQLSDQVGQNAGIVREICQR